MLAFCFAIFLAFGAVLVLVGANQDALAAALGIDLARSGLAASTLALGIGAGMALGGPLADRVARRPLAAAAIGVAAAALLAVSDGMSFARLLMHVFALGAGAGMANVLINVAIVERFGDAAARRLVVLHSAATVGAVAWPGLAAVLGEAYSWTLSFRLVGVAYAVFALWVLRVPLGVPAHARADSLAAARPGSRLELAAYCLTAFAYLGVEGGVTVFAVPFAADGLGLSPDRGRTAISAFWMGLLAGRMSLLLWRGALDARVLVVCGVTGTFALGLAALRTTTQVEWLLGSAGFCIGPVFPLLVALAARTLPTRPGLATGLVTGLGSLGAFVLPWATGAIGD
ncbi:MAG: MFS transporter, partial [Deltaproteobacteria bacterium]|nr:MFS transporter [Deltaproteobacteria bacterium]